jgi:hypothetical protein
MLARIKPKRKNKKLYLVRIPNPVEAPIRK